MMLTGFAAIMTFIFSAVAYIYDKLTENNYERDNNTRQNRNQ